jgi:hypothetical protein
MAYWLLLYAVGRPIMMSLLVGVLVKVGVSEGWKAALIALGRWVMLFMGYEAARNWCGDCEH